MKTADADGDFARGHGRASRRAAQAGSPEAFAALFRRYRPEIARYASRTLGDDARAEDVVQEAFLSALRGIGTLDRPAGFKPWLYRIAHNACVDQMRRRARAEEVSFDANGIPAAEEFRLFRQAPSNHAQVAQKEDFKHLRQALTDLPDSQAEILVLRELEGLSYDDIGMRMRISVSAVESLLFRARRGLRAEYGQISTGERCRSMRTVMAQTVEGIDRPKERRALVRHLRGCTECRRDAFVMGLGQLLEAERRTGVRARSSRGSRRCCRSRDSSTGGPRRPAASPPREAASPPRPGRSRRSAAPGPRLPGTRRRRSPTSPPPPGRPSSTPPR